MFIYLVASTHLKIYKNISQIVPFPLVGDENIEYLKTPPSYAPCMVYVHLHEGSILMVNGKVNIPYMKSVWVFGSPSN